MRRKQRRKSLMPSELRPAAALAGGSMGSSLIGGAMGASGAGLTTMGAGMAGFVSPMTAVGGSMMALKAVRRLGKRKKRR